MFLTISPKGGIMGLHMKVVIKPAGLILGTLLLGAGAVGMFLMARNSATPPAATDTPTSPRNVPKKPVVKNNAPQAPRAGSVVNLIKSENWKFYAEAPAVGRLDSSSPDGAMLRFVVEGVGKFPSNIGYTNRLGAGFNDNEPVELTFRARSPEGCTMRAIMVKNVPGFPMAWQRDFTLTPEWKEYTTAFSTPRYNEAESIFALHLGFGAGTVEVESLVLRRASK
jgi:hypothetical protein